MPKLKPESGDRTVPAGDYLLAMAWFERKRNKQDTADYLRARFQVIEGPSKGRSFFSNVSLDTTKEGAVGRLQIWMRCLEIEEELEIGDSAEGTADAGDDSFEAHFLNKPFGATVSRETQNGYTNNGIDRYIFAEQWPSRWDDAAQEWANKLAEQGNPEDAAADPDPDYVPEATGYVSQARNQRGFDPDDDDIPF